MKWTEHELSDDLTVQLNANHQFEIAGKCYDHAVILSDTVARLPENHLNDLNIHSFQTAIDQRIPLIIIGTGTKQQFLPPPLQAQLSAHGVNVECMNTAAACRTLAMLQSEGRKAWAWLWL